MLYTCSIVAARKEVGKMKSYYIVSDHGNDVVAPDMHDLELYRNGAMTAKGFALNYEMKLRSQEAHEWMERVSSKAAQEDVVLVSEEEKAEKSCRIMLAEMMASMFGGKMSFRYMGEVK